MASVSPTGKAGKPAGWRRWRSTAPARRPARKPSATPASEVEFYDNAEEAKKIFIRGARRAKGTTQELGMTESFFANPFGPVQREAQTRVIIDKVFDKLFETGVPVGNLHTRLAVPGMEHDGPALAAKKLFEILEEK